MSAEQVVMIHRRTDSPFTTAALVARRFLRLLNGWPFWAGIALGVLSAIQSPWPIGASIAIAVAVWFVLGLASRYRAEQSFLGLAGIGYLHVLSGVAPSGFLAGIGAPELRRGINMVHIGRNDEGLALLNEGVSERADQTFPLPGHRLELEVGAGGWVLAAALVRGAERIPIRIRTATRQPQP